MVRDARLKAMKTPAPLIASTLALVLTLLCACGGSGGSSGPPPDAGADPTGSWSVTVLGNAMTGSCWGQRHHFHTWTFVPTGEDTWDVELIDHTGFGHSGTLEAVQDGIFLLVTGTLTTDNGTWSRTYSTNDLIATPTRLSGSLTITTLAGTWCVEFGPLTGSRLASNALADSDVALYRGTWQRSAEDQAQSVLLERDREDHCALLFSDYLLDDRGRDHAAVRSPVFRLDEDGVFSTYFLHAESGKEYVVVGRLDPEGLVTGEIHVLRARDGARLWRGEMRLEQVRALPLITDPVPIPPLERW